MHYKHFLFWGMTYTLIPFEQKKHCMSKQMDRNYQVTKDSKG